MSDLWQCIAPDEYDDPYEATDFCSAGDPGEHPGRHRECGYFKEVGRETYEAESDRLFEKVRDLERQLATAKREQSLLCRSWRYLGKTLPEST